jgi:hypothetical protein
MLPIGLARFIFEQSLVFSRIWHTLPLRYESIRGFAAEPM